jgi:hypothetical protein
MIIVNIIGSSNRSSNKRGHDRRIKSIEDEKTCEIAYNLDRTGRRKKLMGVTERTRGALRPLTSAGSSDSHHLDDNAPCPTLNMRVLDRGERMRR